METYRHTVQYYETDRMGITHHSNYIRWMEEARVDYLQKIGWGYDQLEAAGIVSPVTAVECKYKASTTFADVVEIRVSVAELKNATMRFAYVMTKPGGETVLEGWSEHCFLNKDGRIIRIRRELPEFCSALGQPPVACGERKEAIN